jgi:hypothetical protein
MKEPDPKVALASGEYDELRNCGNPHAVTLRTIAKRNKISYNSLKNYRANYHSRRKHHAITELHHSGQR